jgi:hypothetical protein
VEILVKRNPSKQGATIGRMSVDGVEECYTLEDEVREPETSYTKTPAWVLGWKIPNITAIPRGRYQVTITHSPHFGCDLPLLSNVPGYTAVRIHWGNKAADTDGCLLVGQTTEGNLIYKSKAAFEVLFPKIQAALAANVPVYVTVQ